jgi:myo-inositol-1-phosphate synthase
VLAPLFVARNLRVLAWQGYNMLGNRDGEVLADPLHRESKLRSKGDVLPSILGPDPGGAEVHTHVGIDYVPSLRDWKTAWDFVHFEGFLGARMSLQFTWQGSDSALAAPLVIDLARLADHSAARGESGEMAHVASFFKAPLTEGSHDFHRQFQLLLEYAREHGA